MGITLSYNGLGGKVKFSGTSGKFKTTYISDAGLFFNRVTAAGGTLTQTERSAVSRLVNDLKSANLWDSMKAIYPMVGASAAACAQNLKNSSFTGTFSSGWTFSSNGALPNGTSAYMNTALNPNGTLNYDSFHLSYYSRTQSLGYDGGVIGQGNGSSNNTYLAPYYPGVAAKFFLNGNYPTNAVSINNTTTIGLIVGNKEAINARKLYLNSTLLVTNTTSYTNTFNNNTFYLGALNYGTAQYFTSYQCAFCSIGDGLTNIQESNLYTTVQAFQTTLGRQV